MTSYSEVEDFLEHYGVLGMKWGVRKDRDRTSSRVSNADAKVSEKAQKRRVSNSAKTAAAASIALAVAGVVAGAMVYKSRSNKVSSLSSETISRGMGAVKKILEEPKDIIYVSKPYRGSGKRTTLGFVSDGQTKDFFEIFDKAGLNDDSFRPGEFRKLSNGSVAAFLSDAFGRVDDAGRPIPHLVLVPPNKAVGVNNIEDLVEKIGPQMSTLYEEFVRSRPDK